MRQKKLVLEAARQLPHVPHQKLALRVDGDPAPKGSWKASVSKTQRTRSGAPKIRYRPDSKKLRPWANEISDRARAAWKGAPLLGPFTITRMVFVFRRPKEPEHPYPTTDLDKLERAVFDALTTIVWVDDSHAKRVLEKDKRWAEDGEEPGLILELEHDPKRERVGDY